MQKLPERVVHETITRLFHLDMHSEHKSGSLPPVEWNIKGYKTSTQVHTEVDFLLQFALADYEGFLSVKYLRNQ